MYTDTIRRWAADIRRAGCLPDADGTGEVGLESGQAGKRLAARFTIKVERDRVADARYEVFGCGFSMAACAVAADIAVGYKLVDVQKIDAELLDQALEGLPFERNYCVDLAVEALHAAVKSVYTGRAVGSSLKTDEERDARVILDAPIYMTLMSSPPPDMVSVEDRHLFACLMNVAAQESHEMARMLGLENTDLDALLSLCFPGISLASLVPLATTEEGEAPKCNQDVLTYILNHVPINAGFNQVMVSVWLAQVLATRSSLPGHLWSALGLTERPQLTAAIRRHLPTLADANSQNMRWKRFLYKQVCNINGNTMCKAPDCGVCSDYHLCFVDEKGK